jgi:hypothetical protein
MGTVFQQDTAPSAHCASALMTVYRAGCQERREPLPSRSRCQPKAPRAPVMQLKVPAKSAASACQAARGASQKRREHLPSSSRCLPKPRHPIKATAFPEGKPASHPKGAWRGPREFFFHLPDGHSTRRALCCWSSRRPGTPRQDRCHPSSHPERDQRGRGSLPSRPVTYRRIRSDLSHLRDTPRRDPRPPPRAPKKPRRTWKRPPADPRMTPSDSPGGPLGAWSPRDNLSGGAPGALNPPDNPAGTLMAPPHLRATSAATSPGTRAPRRRFRRHLSRHRFCAVGLKGALGDRPAPPPRPEHHGSTDNFP